MNSNVVFALEEAEWPVLLVDASGVICHANKLAVILFGPQLASGSTPLMEIWSSDNSQSVEEFLATWEGAPAKRIPIKFQTVARALVSFAASICAYSQEDQLLFLLQLFRENAPAAEFKNPPSEANLAQKQKLECALQMARSVSLDFNNALTGILGHTSLVLSQMESTHPLRGSLLEVEKAAARAAEIANDLGTFSRQDKESKAQAAGNLNPLLQRCVDFFKQNPGPEPITWKTQLERKLFAAVFDELKMQQAFLRILENSVQALNGRGHIVVQTRNVELSEATQDRNVRLAGGAYVCAEISDSGCGIEPEVLPRIFEPFFTTKREAKHRGLGLAWVYGIITNHGGGVAISSQTGIGTSVRIYLPAEKRVVNADGRGADDLRGTQTILVVDDEDLVLTMNQAILSAYGYDVLLANSGQKALDILSEKDGKIDLVITDLVMPGMSGRELIEQIKHFSPETPILCTSGYVWATTQMNERGYLQKPFTSQELLVKVKDALSDESQAPN
jgi:signal transduction histidine kinase/ActR/RegA family two-component response regulator